MTELKLRGVSGHKCPVPNPFRQEGTSGSDPFGLRKKKNTKRKEEKKKSFENVKPKHNLSFPSAAGFAYEAIVYDSI